MMELPPNLIQTDFKKIEPGDWFFPMTIKEIDQHQLLTDAIAKGIAGFIYEKGQTIPPTDKPHFEVPDLREFLFNLAEAQRSMLQAKIAVVTGSAGKTSVKELIGSILRVKNERYAHISPDNQNTKIALATQVLRLPIDSKMAVFEIGARRVGDFQVPLKIIKPEIAALLNTGTAHLGEFGSLEALKNEKYSVLSAPSVKTLIVPSDDPQILKYALETGKKVISFGLAKVTGFAQQHVQVLHEDETSLELSIQGERMVAPCRFQSPSRALNVAASVAMALAFDVSLDQIQEGIGSFPGVARRFQFIDWHGTHMIDDAFNASPESLEAGLRLLKNLFPDRKILLVLGSMLEMGSISVAKHREVAHLILELFEELIQTGRLSLITVGEDAQEIANEVLQHGFPCASVKFFSTSIEAKSFIQDLKKDHQVIYFKGSKSIGLQQIFGQP